MWLAWLAEGAALAAQHGRERVFNGGCIPAAAAGSSCAQRKEGA